MGNIISTLRSPNHDYPDTAISELEMNTADDLDFAAAELILTANASHLIDVIHKSGESGTDGTAGLAHEIATAIQDDTAAAKHVRITDSDTETDPEAMRRDVSAFYLNIARVLTTISLAIQPESEPLADSANSDNILSPDFSMSRLSFCGSRIQRFAKVDTDANADDIPNHVAEMTTLGDYYGIPELHDLYFDTDYDAETGAFLGMTDETRTIFDRDLARFYQAFSGETSVPDNIKRFGDIPLRLNKDNADEHTSPMFVCKFDDQNDVDCSPLFTTVIGDEGADGIESSVSDALKSNLLSQFAEHLQKMIGAVIMRRRTLVDLVNQMFVYGTRFIDGERKRHPRVRAYLTANTVAKIATDAHQTITDMSLQCEVDNRIGDELFVALHAIQTLESNENQLRDMEKELELLAHTE